MEGRAMGHGSTGAETPGPPLETHAGDRGGGGYFVVGWSGSTSPATPAAPSHGVPLFEKEKRKQTSASNTFERDPPVVLPGAGDL